MEASRWEGELPCLLFAARRRQMHRCMIQGTHLRFMGREGFVLVGEGEADRRGPSGDWGLLKLQPRPDLLPRGCLGLSWEGEDGS